VRTRGKAAKKESEPRRGAAEPSEVAILRRSGALHPRSRKKADGGISPIGRLSRNALSVLERG